MTTHTHDTAAREAPAPILSPLVTTALTEALARHLGEETAAAVASHQHLGISSSGKRGAPPPLHRAQCPQSQQDISTPSLLEARAGMFRDSPIHECLGARDLERVWSAEEISLHLLQVVAKLLERDLDAVAAGGASLRLRHALEALRVGGLLQQVPSLTAAAGAIRAHLREQCRDLSASQMGEVLTSSSENPLREVLARDGRAGRTAGPSLQVVSVEASETTPLLSLWAETAWAGALTHLAVLGGDEAAALQEALSAAGVAVELCEVPTRGDSQSWILSVEAVRLVGEVLHSILDEASAGARGEDSEEDETSTHQRALSEAVRSAGAALCG